MDIPHRDEEEQDERRLRTRRRIRDEQDRDRGQDATDVRDEAAEEDQHGQRSRERNPQDVQEHEARRCVDGGQDGHPAEVATHSGERVVAAGDPLAILLVHRLEEPDPRPVAVLQEENKTRKADRIRTVTTSAIEPTICAAAPPRSVEVEVVSDVTAWVASGDASIVASPSRRAASPVLIAAATSSAYGRNARAMSARAIANITTMPNMTAAAAPVRDRPRSRRRRANGANVAATMPATRIEAVTVPTTMAMPTTTINQSD